MNGSKNETDTNRLARRANRELGAVALCSLAITLGSSVAMAQKQELKPHGFWSGLVLMFSGKHLLIQCTDGKQRQSDGACTGEVSGVLGSADWPYYSSYKVNTSTGAVLKTDAYFANGKVQDGTPHFLENCRVFDASNWRCDWHNVHVQTGKQFDDGWHDGMKNGRAYRYTTTDGVSDYDGSSISGLELLMFEAGLVDFKSAARGDVLYGLFHH